MSQFSKFVSQFAMALTDTKLNKHLGKKTNSIIELSDGDGLVAKIGLSGKVSWVFRYRFGGKHKRLTFGAFPATSLLKAREKKYQYIGILESGEDPKHHIEESKFVSLEHCRDEWLDKYVSHLKPKTQQLYNSHASKYLNNERFPHDVQKARFEYWLTFFDGVAKESSRVNSGSLLKTIKSMLRWCLSRNIIQHSRVFDITLRAVGESSEVGQRKLSMREVGDFWVTVEHSIAKPQTKKCVQLLLLTGARNSEIREAKRDEFDLHNKMWILPASRSKTGKDIHRPLSDKAVAIIRELDAMFGGSGYLIRGQYNNTCATVHAINRFVKRTWGKMAANNKVEPFTVHDFRRTISTRLSEKGVLPHVTEKMLGHELSGIMAVYNKHDWLDEQREAYELWASMVGDAIKNKLD